MKLAAKPSFYITTVNQQPSKPRDSTSAMCCQSVTKTTEPMT